jgi:alpha-beta hydrolase superfamily lysophospholipase
MAAMALLIPALAAGQGPQPSASGPESSNFTIFFRGVPIGSEQISLFRNADGWNISSSGRLGAPLEIVSRRVLVRYTEDWKPIDVAVDATAAGEQLTIHTVVSGTSAFTHFVRGTQSQDKTDPVPADVILLPSPFWGPYEALAVRLRTAAAGTTIQALGGTGLVAIRVGDSTTDRIQTPARLVEARHTRLTLMTATGPLDGDIWTDAGRLMRISIPAQNVDVVREDIASVSARRVTISRANDETVKIAANGFNLLGTLSKPAGASQGRRPGIVLVGGTDQNDRDLTVAGVPVFGQLAGALADQGFAVLRYDKRGAGQSGGRAEAAALADYADDVRAAVRFMHERKDVDSNRVIVLGHGEGGLMAMLAASKDKQIDALVLVATNGETGAQLNLAQSEHALSRSKKTAAERDATIELQKKIQQAVLTGKGWEDVPASYRKAADTPWFQSFLAFDPAKIMPDVRQPVLIVQPALDTQVAPGNADKLEAMARARKRSAPTEVVRLAGINHLLLPAQTGESDEYVTLASKEISPELVTAVSAWIRKVLP